tara:strand:+ start:71969 stop:73426 length:1458 start_codon:yes stop_codon:yes gene_type:complete
LLGRSRNAYRLWLIRGGAARFDEDAEIDGPPIIALIDAREMDELEQTLRSLTAESVTALAIGTSELPTLTEAVLQIDWKQEPWLMPLCAGDTLARGSIAAYRSAIASADDAVSLFYTDDDLLDENGEEGFPHFKPDWNSELYCHHDYLTGASLLRVNEEDLRECAESQDWMSDLTARATEKARPMHLRWMLHHRRKRPRPRLPAAVSTSWRNLPPVSIIVPTRNRVDLLRTCLEGVDVTDYPDIEVIIVDNDSDDPDTLAYLASLDPFRYRILRHSGPFNFSEINNRAAKEAKGRLLCLLNNDIEMIGPDWLSTMAVQAQREDVGAVGAQLLYPDGRIQHAGVVIGMGNAAGHAHRFLRPDEEGYFHRHLLPQFTMAVTAACLVVDKEKFMDVGGLDEESFPVAFNDVDLCLRLNEKGWQSLYEPRAKLIHHESVSRGLDRDPLGAARFAKELAALQRIWRTDELTDPFHHPQLSRASEQFVIAL